MEKLSVFLDGQFEIMKEYNINAEEMMFIFTLFMAKDEDGDSTYLKTYFTEIKKMSLPREMISSLIEKEVFKDFKLPEKGETLDIRKIEFELKFLNKYFVSTLEAGREFYNEYPPYIVSGNKVFPMNNITKGGFMSMEAFCLAYSKAIRHSRKKHKMVLKAISFAKSQDLISCGICEYLITRKWEEHLKAMEELDNGTFNGKYSIVKDV